jgi:hypothetical protein
VAGKRLASDAVDALTTVAVCVTLTGWKDG